MILTQRQGLGHGHNSSNRVCYNSPMLVSTNIEGVNPVLLVMAIIIKEVMIARGKEPSNEPN